MTVAEIMQELQSLGSESYKRTIMKHGVKEPCYGVKIGDLKKIQKRIKQDYRLALDLYDTGHSDAMYLAGLIADDKKMTKKDLAKWVKQAYCPLFSEYTVPWVCAEGSHGAELAREWIDSKLENVASSGWATWSSLVAITDDAQLDLAELGKLLDRVAKTIHQQPNRVRYTMNGFVIAVGGYVKDLTAKALEVAKKIGDVEVHMGDTACDVPNAAQYLQKMQKSGGIGKKRKTAKC